MIHSFSSTRICWTTAHWWRGVAARPGRQKTLSSSITGRPVISPKRLARIDLPEAPRPKMTTRFIIQFYSARGEFLIGTNPVERRDVLHFSRSPQAPTVQFSMTNLETRPNSHVLL